MQTIQPPKDIIFVRHGRSEANEIKHFLKNRQLARYITHDIRRRAAEHHVLTNEGRWQANKAGEFIAQQLVLSEHILIDNFYTSPLVRAEQTAGLIGMQLESLLPETTIEWIRDRNLREQQGGDLHYLEEKGHVATPEISPNADLYRRPPNGESHFDGAERFETFRRNRAAELAGKTSLIVSHGYFMGDAQIVFEHNGDRDKRAMKAFKKRSIGNCNIVHYTSQNPWTGEQTDALQWVRAVMPFDSPKGSNFDWHAISPEYTVSSRELLDTNKGYKQLLPTKPIQDAA